MQSHAPCTTERLTKALQLLWTRLLRLDALESAVRRVLAGSTRRVLIDPGPVGVAGVNSLGPCSRHG